jgi:hypothetical protein
LSSLARLAIAALLVHALSLGPVRAQPSSGQIYGRVLDERGAALACATVTVRGEQGTARVVTTNARGEFRLLGLEPALHHAQIELAGFSTSEYPEIPVHLGRSTTIEVTLTATSSGAVTLTAECPLLDERTITSGANLTREEIEKLPTARDPWSLLQQAPGVLTDRTDVGGGDGGQPVVVRAIASGIDQNAYAIDGVPITDPDALESTPTVYDFGSFDEAQITTGGTDVEVATPGAALNLVTRRGTNAWRAAVRYLVADGDLQPSVRESKLDLPPGQTSFEPSPRLDSVIEYGAEGGGPVVADRLWIWAGYNGSAVDLDLDPPPTAFEQGAGDRDAETAALKIDAALGRSNRLQVFGYDNRVTIDAIGGGPERADAATLDLEAPVAIYKLEDFHLFGSSLYLHGQLSRVDQDTDFTPRGGSATPTVDAGGVFRDGYLRTESDRRRDLVAIEASGYWTGAGLTHDVRLGVSRRDAESRTVSRWGDEDTVFVENDSTVGASMLVFFQPAAPELRLDVESAYLQDTFTRGGWIADLGLRYDRQEGERGGELLAAHPVRPDLLPALSVPGASDASRWEDLVPRVGLTYALGERHATLVRASWSRFADQMSTRLAAQAISDPELAPLPFAAVRFFDRDADGRADADETQITILGSLEGTVLDPGLEAPETDEILVGAEHAGVGCFSIGGRMIWRRYRGLLEERPFVRDAAGNVRVVDRADYALDTLASGRLPDGTAYAVPVFALRSELEPLGARLLTNGQRQVEYRGATVWLERRLRNRWEFRANGNVRDEVWNAPAELLPADDPTDLVGFADNQGAPFGPESVFADQRGVYLHSRWDYSLAGIYRARAGIVLGMLVHGREGFPVLYFENVEGDDNRTRSVAVTDEDSPLRLENVHLLDVRLEKELRLGDAALTLSVDALNLLSKTPALEREARLEIPTADFVREVVSPRTVRLGARIEFD